MFKGLRIVEACLMTVESAPLSPPFYDTLTQLLHPLQHLCFLNALNATFNMTWQTKQIKRMISRTRQPDQTHSQRAPPLMICRQKGVGQGESFPLLFIVNLNIWKCIRHQESFSASLNSARPVCSVPLRLTTTNTCTQSILRYLALNN